MNLTFNLGPCFVETRGQKHIPKSYLDLISSLGWCASYLPKIFTHLSSVLGRKIESSLSRTNEMVIGTDEEKEVKSLKYSFPDSKLTLCIRHLGENFKGHLKNIVGMNEKEYEEKKEKKNCMIFLEMKD